LSWTIEVVGSQLIAGVARAVVAVASVDADLRTTAVVLAALVRRRTRRGTTCQKFTNSDDNIF